MHKPHVVVGLGIVGLQPQRFCKGRPRRRQVSLLLEDQAEIVVRFGHRRVEPQCLAVTFHGLVQLT